MDRHRIVEVARLIGAARGAFASHVWRGSASGNLGGWQVARAIQLLTVLTASVGTPGGHVARAPGTSTSPSSGRSRPPTSDWNDLLFPKEWPLSHYEMSFLLPHFLKEGRGKARHLFHARVQPGLDEPGRDDVGRGPEGRGAGRPARRPHPDLERDRDLRRLRPAHGPRRRAPRHPEPGDAVRASG